MGQHLGAQGLGTVGLGALPRIARMIDWNTTLAPALQDRLVLLLNHLIGREPAAMAKLLPFAGAQVLVAVRNGPAWAPALPDLALAITPAGLFERLDSTTQPQLEIELDGSNPLGHALAALRGQRQGVSISGDAALAGAMNWLFENLRPDPADELARAVGPAPAQFVAQAAASIRQALSALMARS